MSNKNTNGGSIWGQKMGLGSPAMFTAVDDEGNTNYTTGCQLYKSAGIEYKMATTNICSSIWGLNASDDASDVYLDDADWVDYKTFKGSQGTHDTKYVPFYEMKIPFSALGIDKNYIETNGIGAMLVATRALLIVVHRLMLQVQPASQDRNFQALLYLFLKKISFTAMSTVTVRLLLTM